MHMQKLSPRISLYTPEPPDQEDQLVILCSWADAQRKHITKYIQLHKAITPGASILLIQTSAATLFQPYTWQRAALKPAAQYIVENALTDDRQQASSPDKGGRQTQQEQGRNKTKILFHLCSNGGSLTATQLLILLRGMTHAPLPLIGIIMDSAPDSGGYNHTHNAVVYSQPSRPRKAVVSVIAHTLLVPMYASFVIRGTENTHLQMRRILLDRYYVGTSNIYYIYSKSDTSTNWRHVLIHAQEARWKGWFVEEYKLEQSPHCAHIRSNPELYAGIVRRLWGLVKPQAKL